MAVGVAWAVRNLGLDPSKATPGAASGGSASSPAAEMRAIIDFDSEGRAGAAFSAQAKLASTGLSKFVPIKWPAGLTPEPGTKPSGESLPKADVLIVTWTMDEGHALSRVLTPGFDSDTGWKPYVKNFATISKDMRADCPAVEAKRLGTYWTTKIGSKTVTLFKSDSHMSQDGPKLPNATVWKQIIADCEPKWVITTGTGGGIGPSFEVGDVIVSRFATFDCKHDFARLNGESFTSPKSAPATHFTAATSLFEFNAPYLPKDNTRKPKIFTAASAKTGILTTDFFGFDNTADTYQLESKGDLSEMGDAVLGMVCKELGSAAPPYAVVRNVSDPQIDSKGLSLEQQTTLAGDIYKGYGRWSTVCSAIVCWSIVASL